jgi:hypothetical protein
VSNPYRPSNAALKDSPTRHTRPVRPPRSATVSVIAGLAIDIGGTTVVGIVIAIVYGILLAGRGTAPEQIQEALTQVDTESGFFLFNAAVGLGFSMLGAYVCARMVKRDELRVTAIMAVLSNVMGFLMSRDSTLGAGEFFAFTLATFVVILVGGALGRRRNRALAADSPDVGAA